MGCFKNNNGTVEVQKVIRPALCCRQLAIFQDLTSLLNKTTAQGELSVTKSDPERLSDLIAFISVVPGLQVCATSFSITRVQT